jgi:hypothetical protein
MTSRNGNARANIDPLQKVNLEAPDNRRGSLRVALLRYPEAKRSRSSPLPLIEFGDDTREILQLGPGRPQDR